MSVVVRLFTKADCTLCVPVKFILKKAHQRIPFQYEEVNITDAKHAAFFDLYKHDIPVVHINGTEYCRHRMDEKAFVHAITQEITKNGRI